jgi:hypothetical protein
MSIVSTRLGGVVVVVMAELDLNERLDEKSSTGRFRNDLHFAECFMTDSAGIGDREILRRSRLARRQVVTGAEEEDVAGEERRAGDAVAAFGGGGGEGGGGKGEATGRCER